MSGWRIFPDERIAWYLSRGFVAGLVVGVVLAAGMTVVVLMLSAGGGGPGVWADWLKSLILPVAGWTLNGVVVGLVAWLIARARSRSHQTGPD